MLKFTLRTLFSSNLPLICCNICCKSPSAQLGLGSEIVDLYRDARSVTYSHLLIDFSPRTDDVLCYCTHSGSFQSFSHIPDRFKFLISLDDNKQNLSTPQLLVFFSHKSKDFFFQPCPKEFIRLLWNAS